VPKDASSHEPNARDQDEGRSAQGLARRDKLVIDHQDYVRAQAAILRRQLGGHFELDELVAMAQPGLIRAAERFDDGRNARFTTFAHKFIRGAILRSVRKLSNLPPVVRNTAAREAGADAIIESDDVFSGPPVSPEQRFARIVGKLAVHEAMAGAWSAQDEAVAPSEHANAATHARHRDAMRRLREIIPQVPRESREVIDMALRQGKTFQEIGDELGIEKTKAHRLYWQGVTWLRTQMLEAKPPAGRQHADPVGQNRRMPP